METQSLDSSNSEGRFWAVFERFWMKIEKNEN
jgi:hypothetical protein